MPVTHAQKAFPRVRRLTVELEDGMTFLVEGTHVTNVEMTFDRALIEKDPWATGNFQYKDYDVGETRLHMKLELEGPANVTWSGGGDWPPTVELEAPPRELTP